MNIFYVRVSFHIISLNIYTNLMYESLIWNMSSLYKIYYEKYFEIDVVRWTFSKHTIFIY